MHASYSQPVLINPCFVASAEMGIAKWRFRKLIVGQWMDLARGHGWQPEEVKAMARLLHAQFEILFDDRGRRNYALDKGWCHSLGDLLT